MSMWRRTSARDRPSGPERPDLEILLDRLLDTVRQTTAEIEAIRREERP